MPRRGNAGSPQALHGLFPHASGVLCAQTVLPLRRGMRPGVQDAAEAGSD